MWHPTLPTEAHRTLKGWMDRSKRSGLLRDDTPLFFIIGSLVTGSGHGFGLVISAFWLRLKLGHIRFLVCRLIIHHTFSGFWGVGWTFPVCIDKHIMHLFIYVFTSFGLEYWTCRLYTFLWVTSTINAICAYFYLHFCCWKVNLLFSGSCRYMTQRNPLQTIQNYISQIFFLK